MNIALDLFDAETSDSKSKGLLSIASQLLTIDHSTSGNSPAVSNQAHFLLHKLYPKESLFLEKKVYSHQNAFCL